MNLGINPALCSQNNFANKNVSAKRATRAPLSNTTPLAPQQSLSFGRGFFGFFEKLTPEQKLAKMAEKAEKNVARAIKDFTEAAKTKSGAGFNPDNAFNDVKDNWNIVTPKQRKQLQDTAATSQNPFVSGIISDIFKEVAQKA